MKDTAVPEQQFLIVLWKTAMQDAEMKSLHRIRKYAGATCCMIGLILIFIGLAVFLAGPEEKGITNFEQTLRERSGVQVQDFVEYSCEVSISKVMEDLSQEIYLNISLNGDDDLDLYLMNSTQQANWSNGSDPIGQVEHHDVNFLNTAFRVNKNATYYLVLFNPRADNTSTATSFRVFLFHLVPDLDYSIAFKGLQSAIAGGILFAISLPLYNPIHKILSWNFMSIFPGLKQLTRATGPPAITFTWGTLGSLSLIISLFVLWLLGRTSQLQLPAFIIPFVQDLWMRIGLFFFFLSFQISFISLLIGGYLHDFLSGFVIWFFGVRKGRSLKTDLYERQQKFFWKEMSSSTSLVFYTVIFLLLWIAFVYIRDIFAILAVFLFPIGLLFGHNIYISFHKACEELNLDYEKEMDETRFLHYGVSVSWIITGAMVFLTWHGSFALLGNLIYERILGYSKAIELVPTLGQRLLVLPLEVVRLTHFLRGEMILLFAITMSIVTTLFFFFGYSVRPVRQRELTLRGYVTEIEVFLLTFVATQLFALLSQPYSPSITAASLIASLAIASLSAFMKRALREILVKPRHCAFCHRDLSHLPVSITACPYCGKAINEHN